MFTAKQAFGDKLPPSTGSLLPALKRANYQAFVCSKDYKLNAVIHNPVVHGWCFEEGVPSPTCQMFMSEKSMFTTM